MKALITGGAGFVGSHLAEALVTRGYSVTAIDNLSTGVMANVASLKDNPHFQLVIGDVTERSVLLPLVEECEVVFHLAAAVGVRLVVEKPVHTIETNLKGTEAVLEAAARGGKKVLVTSTSEVYGRDSKASFREDDDLLIGPPTKSRWSYACSKLMDEFLALAFWKQRKLPVVIARLFNTAGPRQTGRYGMVIPTFVRQALQGDAITVFGSGKQQRAFGYVGDVVGALIALMERDDTSGEVFNVGNDVEINIEDLAQLVKDMTASRSRIVHVPYDQAYETGFEDMERRVPDLTKVRRWIGYAPQHQLGDILGRVIASMRTEHSLS